MTKQNKTTKIFGLYIDVENGGAQRSIEAETEYTRSMDKARKLLAEKLELNEQFVIVTKIENEAAKPFKWNALELATDFIINYNEPEKTDGYTNVKYNLYDYVADVFGYKDELPKAETISVVDCAYKATKGDARSIVREHALESGYFDSVVYTSTCRILESEVWACVPNEVIDNYKKYVK